MVTISSGQTFFAATPAFTNVHIRIAVDVIDGEFQIFITDSDKRFAVRTNDSTSEEILDFLPEENESGRKRRELDKTAEFVPAIQTSKDSMTTFAKYEGGVLLVNSVRKRVIITINHEEHDLRKKWFYLVLKPIIRSNSPHQSPAKAFVYYRQDLPRIDLLLFFLVLSVILFFILSGFIIGMKIRLDIIRNHTEQIQETELNAMRNRPLASYSLLFNRNEDLSTIRKRKSKIIAHSRHKNSNNTPNEMIFRNERKLVMPVAVQETEDNLAAVCATFIQYPENEFSKWNFSLGIGICQVNNQHLIQVKNSQGVQGKRINTRILATQA